MPQRMTEPSPITTETSTFPHEMLREILRATSCAHRDH